MGAADGCSVRPCSPSRSAKAPAIARPRPDFFAPPPLAEARGGVAILGGVLDEKSSRGTRNGYLEIKPAFILSPTIGFEPYVGMALTENGNQLLYGGAFTVHLAPDWAIEPYGTLGLGALSTFPNSDQFVLQKGDGLGRSRRRGALARAAPPNPGPTRGQQRHDLHRRLVSQRPDLPRRSRCLLLNPATRAFTSKTGGRT